MKRCECGAIHEEKRRKRRKTWLTERNIPWHTAPAKDDKAGQERKRWWDEYCKKHGV